MEFESKPIGREVSAVFYGVDGHLLNDTAFLEKVVLEGLEKSGFHILGALNHKFSPRGYTLNVLLSESHLAMHTYPEFGSVYIGFYSCKGEFHGKSSIDYLVEMLKPTTTVMRMNNVVVKSNAVLKDFQ